MIFCDENEKTKQLAELLSILFKDSSIPAHINSSLFTKKRLTLIKSSNTEDIHVVVCSDATSRGVDIENLNCVINNLRFWFMKQDQCSFLQATPSFRPESCDKIFVKKKIMTRRPTLISFIFLFALFYGIKLIVCIKVFDYKY